MRLISEPIILVGAPRSGTSILFHVLSSHPDLWSLYRESHSLMAGRYEPLRGGRDSHVLTEHDLDERAARELEAAYFRAAGNLEAAPRIAGRVVPLIARAKLAPWISRVGGSRKEPPIRLVEKTPENSFRIRFLRQLFPDARFVLVGRDPRASIASMYRGWHQPRKFKMSSLPSDFHIVGYRGSRWSFGLPPGWRSWSGRTLMEICALQWTSYVEHCLRDLGTDDPAVLRIRYEDLVRRPAEVLPAVADWARIDPQPLARFFEHLPVINTRTRPRPDKWRRLEAEIRSVLPIVEDAAARLGYDVRTRQ
jgi:hypothetical protein